MTLVRTLDAWHSRPADYPRVEPFAQLLLGHPGHFRVEEVHNPLMVDAEGQPRRIDPELALAQWQAMLEAFEASGLTCHVLEANPELPDLCFTANPSFVMPVSADRREAWLANMRFAPRRPESELHAGFLHAAGYLLRRMPDPVQRFEGHGDGLWHPGRFLLHAGVGTRTEHAAWEAIQAAYPELDILLYGLQPGDCYHLDTALAALSEDCALVVPTAFSAEGLELVRAAFPERIELTPEQGSALYGNAFSADGKTVFLPAGDPELAARIEAQGFAVVELEMSEFHKAGGSIFCSKLGFA